MPQKSAVISVRFQFQYRSIPPSLTCLLLLAVRQLLDGAAVAEAADRTGQPFSQSVSRAFGTGRAGLQRAEGRLRLEVGH